MRTQNISINKNEKAIKTNQYTIEDNSLKGSGKGFVKIPSSQNHQNIEKVFLSNNQIKSLNGIQLYQNVKVLSISYNEISNFCELQYLKGLSLHNLTMEGNPITKLPYYSHHVVTMIPSLRLLDGNVITEEIRQKALDIISLENEYFMRIIQNNIKIIKLENALNRGNNPENKDFQEWSMKTKNLLNSSEDVSLTQSDIDDRVNQIRESAIELKSNNKKRWIDIYQTIEDLQEKTIAEISEKIQKIYSSRAISSKPQRYLSQKQENNSNSLNTMGKNHIKNISTPISQEIDNDNDIFDTILLQTQTLSPVPRSSPPVQECTLDLFACFSSLKKHRIQRNIMKAWLQLVHQSYSLNEKESYYVNESTMLELRVECSFEINKPLCESITETPQNIDLLEEAQIMAQRISELEYENEAQKNDISDLSEALAQSEDKSAKRKNLISKLTKKNADLSHRLQLSDKRYEEEILEMVLQQKFKYEGYDRKFQDLESKYIHSREEVKTLNEYIITMKDKHESEKHSLNKKLESAFTVAGEFRKEISKLQDIHTPQTGRILRNDSPPTNILSIEPINITPFTRKANKC